MRRRTSAEMFPLIELYEKGTSSKEDLLKEWDLKECTFNYWLSKYKKIKDGPSSFVALNMGRKDANSVMEIEMPNGKRLIFSTLVPIEYLRTILELRC